MFSESLDEGTTHGYASTLLADGIATEAEAMQEWEEWESAQFIQPGEYYPDNLLWCLLCHKRGHRGLTRDSANRRVQKGDPWDLLSRRYLYHSPIIECPGLEKLINILSVLDVSSLEYNSHIQYRDGMLESIYGE